MSRGRSRTGSVRTSSNWSSSLRSNRFSSPTSDTSLGQWFGKLVRIARGNVMSSDITLPYSKKKGENPVDS